MATAYIVVCVLALATTFILIDGAPEMTSDDGMVLNSNRLTGMSPKRFLPSLLEGRTTFRRMGDPGSSRLTGRFGPERAMGAEKLFSNMVGNGLLAPNPFPSSAHGGLGLRHKRALGGFDANMLNDLPGDQGSGFASNFGHQFSGADGRLDGFGPAAPFGEGYDMGLDKGGMGLDGGMGAGLGMDRMPLDGPHLSDSAAMLSAGNGLSSLRGNFDQQMPAMGGYDFGRQRFSDMGLNKRSGDESAFDDFENELNNAKRALGLDLKDLDLTSLKEKLPSLLNRILSMSVGKREASGDFAKRDLGLNIDGLNLNNIDFSKLLPAVTKGLKNLRLAMQKREEVSPGPQK